MIAEVVLVGSRAWTVISVFVERVRHFSRNSLINPPGLCSFKECRQTVWRDRSAHAARMSDEPHTA
jgi:hypothetical protein